MPETLATERLRLRQWHVSDAEQLRALWAERDPRSLRLIDVHGKPDVSDLRSNIEAGLEATVETGLALLVVERVSRPGFIGYCGLTVGRATYEEPEVAFELFRREHGLGYATEAGEVVVAAAAATGRSRLWASVRTLNQPSLRVLEKLGFVLTPRVDADPLRGDLLWLTRDLSPPANAAQPSR
jgi:RimJ/RimL family protein N-acetyltransferase